MRWFKHFIDFHDDSSLVSAIRVFGPVAYQVFLWLHEMYAKYYEERDEDGFVSITYHYSFQILRIHKSKLNAIAEYLAQFSLIQINAFSTSFSFKINGFQKLIGKYTVLDTGNSRGKQETGNMEGRVNESEDAAVMDSAREILSYFNSKTGKNLKDASLIVSLLRQGKQKEDFLKIIDRKLADVFFQHNPHLYNLKTLFAGDRFDSYLADCRHHASIGPDSPASSSPDSSASPDTLNIFRLFSAYYKYLMKEMGHLHDKFMACVHSSPSVRSYVEKNQLWVEFDSVAVVSFDTEKIVFFHVFGFSVPFNQFCLFFSEASGLDFHIQKNVPDDFLSSPFFSLYY